jgi:hypothetical protein
VTGDYPNVERILLDEFDALFDWESGAVLPALLPDDVGSHLPFVVPRRIGGNADNVNDYPLIQIDVYADTYAVAMDVAEQIRHRLLSGHVYGPHGQIDRAICTSAHIELPHEDEAVRRFSTQYRVTCRRTAP